MSHSWHVSSNLLNSIEEAILDYRISHQKLTGVYHTSYELMLGANPVQSSDYPIIRSVISRCALQRDDTIIDIGCGMGRFLGYLSLRGFSGNLIGIEIDRTYADFCSYMFAKKKNISIICDNAIDIASTFPDDAVLYLYNPFSAKVLDMFLSEARGKKIIYTNSINEAAFSNHPEWKLHQKWQSSLNDGTPVPAMEFINQR
jgi:SAM-dependent methyltransferase